MSPYSSYQTPVIAFSSAMMDTSITSGLVTDRRIIYAQIYLLCMVVVIIVIIYTKITFLDMQTSNHLQYKWKLFLDGNINIRFSYFFCHTTTSFHNPPLPHCSFICHSFISRLFFGYLFFGHLFIGCSFIGCFFIGRSFSGRSFIGYLCIGCL